jgi:hypothetical protein
MFRTAFRELGYRRVVSPRDGCFPQNMVMERSESARSHFVGDLRRFVWRLKPVGCPRDARENQWGRVVRGSILDSLDPSLRQ